MSGRSRREVLCGGLAAGGLLATAGIAASPPLRLRRGINTWPWFSLTREFPAPRTDYDWPAFQPQRPVPTAQDLRRLRQAGFDFIRLPVDPGPFLAAAADRRAGLMAMLGDAVTLAVAADLSVLVNLQANGATHFWTPERMAGSREAPAFGQFLDFTRQVARLLRPFDSARVALEPVNEPPQACAESEWPLVQQALLAAARAENLGLTLVATGACGSMIAGLQALDPAPLKALAPLLFTFHFYEPYLFSHQGAPWMREPVYRSLNHVPWPGDSGGLEATLAATRARMAQDLVTPVADKAAAMRETEKLLGVYFEARPDIRFIQQYFGMVTQWAKAHDIPMNQMLLGEFGALRSGPRYVAADKPDAARYIRDVRLTAEAAGLPWAFWNLFDGFGIIDDSSRAFDPDITGALGLAMPSG